VERREMYNYAKGYGCLQGHLEVLHNTLEVKIMHDYMGKVTIPKEVTEELKAQISHMLKRSEEVGNEPSEFMNMPKKEEKEDKGWYLEYDASNPTCNLPVPEEKAPHGAGSYHDQEHHNKLMDRVEDLYEG
jgi:hypothetical protein